MSKHLQIISDALDKERRSELDALRQRLRQAILNLPCDVSATDEAFHHAVREGHKQARHAALDVVHEMFDEVENRQ